MHSIRIKLCTASLSCASIDIQLSQYCRNKKNQHPFFSCSNTLILARNLWTSLYKSSLSSNSYNACINMSAFIQPFCTSTRSRNIAFHGTPVTSTSHTSTALTSTRRSRSATIIKCQDKQFNYNIYQDVQDRSRRSLTEKDRAVAVQKPLGLVLEEGKDGMVFIAEMDPDGNAAETGEVNEGDILVAVSATFGEEVWSTRGVGLDIVMKSIRIRAGDFVTLVLESPDQAFARKNFSAEQAASRRTEAREKFGEREVLDPVSWRSAAPPGSTGAIYEDGDPAAPTIDDQLKEKLKKEVAAPYEQNWILWAGGAVFLLVILSVIFGIGG